jgi:hypothetical protein
MPQPVRQFRHTHIVFIRFEDFRQVWVKCAVTYTRDPELTSNSSSPYRPVPDRAISLFFEASSQLNAGIILRIGTESPHSEVIKTKLDR